VWYEYTCPRGHVTERRGGVADAALPCSCGEMAQRRPFNHAAIVGATVAKDERRRTADFVEASAEVDYHYTKAENEGMSVKRPDLWGIAKKKAGI